MNDTKSMFSYLLQDTAGDVLCYCPNGYALDANSDCIDINECDTGDHICSLGTSDCVNEAPG